MRRNQRLSSPAIAGAARAAEVIPDNVIFRDTFEGDTVDPAWLAFTSATTTFTRTVADGRLNLQVSAGATSGSFWYNVNDGCLLYREVEGPFDARARVEVRNNANSGPPPASSYRLGVLAAHDPIRTPYNYVHTGPGTVNGVQNQIEWKDTDESFSTFAGIASDSGTTAVDVRLVRRATAPNVYDLYHRDGAGLELDDDTGGWTLTQTIDRTANPLGPTNQVGFAVYSNVVAHDVRMFVDEIVVLTTEE